MSRAPVHLVTDRASVFTDHRMHGHQFLPSTSIFKTVWEQALDNFSNRFQSSFLKFWSSKQRVETLHNGSVILFASSQDLSTHFFAWPSMSLDHATVFAKGLSHPGDFSVASAEIRDSNIFRYSSMTSFVRLALTMNTSQYTWSRNDVGSPRSTSFINLFHMVTIFCFFSSHFWCHPRIPTRVVPVFDEHTDIPNSVLFFKPSSNRPSSTCLSLPAKFYVIHVERHAQTYTDSHRPCCRCADGHSQFGTLSHPSRNNLFFQMVFPTMIWHVDDHTDFVREEPLGLQYLTMIWATCVVKDVSGNQDILTLGFWAMLEHPPFLLGFEVVLGRLLVRQNLVVLQWHPLLWPPSFEMQMILALWISHKSLNRLSQCHLGVRPSLYSFDTLVLTPRC